MATLRAEAYAARYLDQIIENIRLGLMTAPGITDVLDMRTCGAGVSFQYVVRNVDTNVVIAAEGSQDNINWYRLHPDVTKTADGDYSVVHPYKENYVRFRFTSESGGTGATIAVDALPHQIG